MLRVKKKSQTWSKVIHVFYFEFNFYPSITHTRVEVL